MTVFTPWEGLVGGGLIGLATVIWLALYGRVTGISGIFGSAFFRPSEGGRGWRWFYLAGLLVGGIIYFATQHNLPGLQFNVDLQAGWVQMVIAGVLVGFGTRMSNGCTSGHGVCGLARLSTRSLVAVVSFMAAGFITVYIARHLLGVL